MSHFIKFAKENNYMDMHGYSERCMCVCMRVSIFRIYILFFSGEGYSNYLTVVNRKECLELVYKVKSILFLI